MYRRLKRLRYNGIGILKALDGTTGDYEFLVKHIAFEKERPGTIVAPTLEEVVKWLQEEYKIFIWVSPLFKEGDTLSDVRWEYKVQPLQKLRSQMNKRGFTDSDEALEAAIEKALSFIERILEENGYILRPAGN